MVTVSTASGGTVEGKVIDLTENRVTLLAGTLRLTADRVNVQKVIRVNERPKGNWDFTAERERPKVYECDIRGMHYEQAMDEVNRFVDNAVLNNLENISIIHGLGTGALREGVRELLQKRRDVAHFEHAHPDQGGFGCTQVTLKH
jgi:DNA mismatch repair protein MutS2